MNSGANFYFKDVSKEEIRQRKELSKLSKAELIDRIIDQEKVLRTQRDRLEKLGQQVAELTRAGKRQAAPFRRDDSQKKQGKKKTPGRKEGHKGHFRAKPEQVDEAIEVSLPEACPYCQGQIEGVKPIEQWIEELPPIRPLVYHLTTYQGHCCQCQRTIRSSHPLQLGHAQGASGVHLGRRASALVLQLQHQFGLSKRKVCQMLNQLFGIKLSPGAVVHLNHRMADKLGPEYDQLLTQARQSAHIHADETSWYVGEPKHWLWVFTHPHFTLYQIAPNRSREVIYATVGRNYSGVMISDCYVSYDGVNPVQQKCYSHHLKELSRLREQAGTDPPDFWRKAKQVFQVALGLKKRQHAMKPEQVKHIRKLLEERADKLFGPTRTDELEEKFANRIRKQRDHLFTFLDYPFVPATNNLAERQLRPAVINRKLSCGNKTQQGAQTWQVLASIWATAQQQSKDFSQIVDQAISRHLNILRAEEVRSGIGPIPINEFQVI